MSKRMHVSAFSLNKQTETLLNRLQSKYQKSRSELLRVMINSYVDSPQKPVSAHIKQEFIDESEVNKILKLYYKLLSETKPKTTLVIGIGIVNKKNKVLIGLRKNQNKLVKDLHWTFPSGKFDSLDFEKQILKKVKEETGLTVKVIKLLHARLIPDSPQKPVRIIALYYHLKLLSGTEKAGGDFKELKWVPAAEVSRHFTTSVSDEIMNFLGTLS